MPILPLAPAFTANLHPRLLFAADEIPAFRENARHGIAARALAELLRRCTRATHPSSPDYLDLQRTDDLLGKWFSGIGNWTSDALHALAFAWLLTGEQRWAEHGIALLRHCCHPQLLKGDISHATFAGEVPRAYDILHPVMSPEDRALVSHFLSEKVAAYQRDVLDRPIRRCWSLGTNLFIHEFHLYVLALAALEHTPQRAAALRQCGDLLRQSFHLGVDEGGAIGEGPSYGWSDLCWVTEAAEVLRRAGVGDLWAEEPHFQQMVRHWAYLVLPGRRGQNTIGDAWRQAGNFPLWPHLFLHHRSGDPTLKWIWENMGGRGVAQTVGPTPERFSPKLGFIALWDNDRIAAADPGAQHWPSNKSSGAFGVTVLRSGWSDDDLYFSLLAAGRTPGCHIHQHVDAGHFTLFALNEAFSIDSGYGDGRGEYHSLFMPDGKEPPGAPADFGTCFTGGSTDAFAADPHAAYVRVNIREQWNCVWNYRHALMVNAPGAAPYIILFDNVNYRNTYGFGHWLLNSEPGNRIEVDEEAGRASILGKQHRLECLWAMPSAGMYPEAHRLDLATDVIDSFPIGHRTLDVDYFAGLPSTPRPRGGGRWGAGLRPRIKATLWGYNGVLLSALVPRRQDQPQVRYERFGQAEQIGLTVHLDGVSDTILVNPFNRELSLGGIAGEATMAVVRRGSAGQVLWWAAADAFRLNVDDAPVLPRRGTVVTLATGVAGAADGAGGAAVTGAQAAAGGKAAT